MPSTRVAAVMTAPIRFTVVLPTGSSKGETCRLDRGCSTLLVGRGWSPYLQLCVWARRDESRLSTSLRLCWRRQVWLQSSSTSTILFLVHKFILTDLQAREKALHGGLVDHLDFLQADAEAVAFEERSFDRILCSSGMLYMQDPCGALRKFSGWLASGGELHFNTPQV